VSGEGFLDVSSVGAQGNQTFDAGPFAAPPYNHCYIKIKGMAPGASVIYINASDASGFLPTSAVLEGIDYAVGHNADVINESFGSNPYPDASNDPITLADEAAVSLGILVSTASGDAGPMGTIGSSSTAPVPGIISAGATTSFRAYAQLWLSGFQLGSLGWLDNNISGLSSAGIGQSGKKTISVVAPGDLNWILCDASLTFVDGCGLLPFQVIGGTSEAAPLTSGEAALIIEAYRNTHGGASPSPVLVQQIIQGTATDLGVSSDEQGAGLLNAFRAVQAAMSYKDANGSPAPVGSSLVTSPFNVAATTQPGTSLTRQFQVTNAGSSTQTVRPTARTLNPIWHQSFTPFLDANSPNAFFDGVQFRPFVTQTFTIPAGLQRLDASIAWNNASKPDTLVRVTLFDPQGNFANWSIPQDSTPLGYQPTSRFGHTEVTEPAAGTWTAVIWGHRPANGFTGHVNLDITGSRYVQVGTVSPASLNIAPGQTGTFQLQITSPASPGDLNADIVLNQNFTTRISPTAGVIPVIIRSLVTSSTARTNIFRGVLTGGNGRFPAPGQEIPYQFDVPPGQRDLDLAIFLADPGYNLEGVLSDPNGNPLDVQSTITSFLPNSVAPASTTNKLQFFWANPMPGRWSFLLIINNAISGNQTAQPFTGTLSFNGVNATAAGLPTNAATKLPAGVPATFAVKVTNTGNTTEQYFVDPRLNSQATITYAFTQDLPFPALDPLAVYPSWPPAVVPPKSTQLLSAMENATGSSPSTVPLLMDVSNLSGAPAEGITGQPDTEGIPFVDPNNGLDGVAATVQAPELAMGPYWNFPMESGDFTNSAPVPAHSLTVQQVTTQAFDFDVSTDTGDAWINLTFDPSATYSPLVLAPHQSGTIHVTFTPSGTAGTVVSGQLNLETLAVDPTGLVITGVSDEVAALPYTYTIS
jgi:hypothetical protein